VNYIAEKQRVAGFRTEKRHAVTGNWAVTLRRTNHPLFPDEGYLLNLQLGGAPGIVVAETAFFRAYGKAVGYLKAGSRGVITLRGELGSVWAGEVTGVPSDYLFRTGGDSTVRGYSYQSLGVERGDAVVGGRALAVASAEYTHWVTPDWGAAVFYDAGNAAAKFSDIRLAQGYGLGARWRSPVGPLNLDLAYGERSGKVRLHFSVGIFF
jgi:translocation and assembly module TamA